MEVMRNGHRICSFNGTFNCITYRVQMDGIMSDEAGRECSPRKRQTHTKKIVGIRDRHRI